MRQAETTLREGLQDTGRCQGRNRTPLRETRVLQGRLNQTIIECFVELTSCLFQLEGKPNIIVTDETLIEGLS